MGELGGFAECGQRPLSEVDEVDPGIVDHQGGQAFAFADHPSRMCSVPMCLSRRYKASRKDSSSTFFARAVSGMQPPDEVLGRRRNSPRRGSGAGWSRAPP
jgi:hypothetical protein